LSRVAPDAGSPFARKGQQYDPAALTAQCSKPGGGRASGPSSVQQGTVKSSDGSELDFTYGGAGERFPGYVVDEDGQVGVGHYRGLSKEEAARLRLAAYEAMLKAMAEAEAAEKKIGAEKRKSGPDSKETEAAIKEFLEAYKRFREAVRKAEADPNVELSGGIARVAASTECETALENARRVLTECQLSEWRSGACKSLQAQLFGCSDPALIYVDPDAGYACAQKIDAAVVKAAWVERCRKLKRPVTGGSDPCLPPKVDPSGKFLEGKINEVCGGPQAYVTPDLVSSQCVVPFTIRDNRKSAHEMYVWGLNVLGGPIVVFGPRIDPGVGPKPRPTRP